MAVKKQPTGGMRN